MKFTRHNLVNVTIVVTAVLLFGGFLALALPGENKSNDALDAIAATSTTARRDTTTVPTTSTTLSLATTTTAPTPTTVRTTTTKKPSTSTPTTQRTTTTAAGGPRGRVTERSDNTMTFTHTAEGACAGSPTAQSAPAGTSPFRFVLSTNAACATSPGSDTASVTFRVALTNTTSKAIVFPGEGMKLVFKMTTSGGSVIEFDIERGEIDDIRPGETITVTQDRGVSGYGTFDVSASCDVDYG